MLKTYYTDMDEVFYDLIDEGYIYDEDENGFNMSYGEYAAVAEYMEECLKDAVSACFDFEEALKTYMDFLDCSDDAMMFSGLEEELETVQSIFTDEWFGNNLLWVCYDEAKCPECLKEFWNWYKEEHAEEYEAEEDEEEDETA